MPAKLIASYRRELSALADLQDAGTVTYTLLREADAYCIRAQRDTAPADGVLSNGQLFKGLLKDLRDKTEQYL